MDKYKRSYAYTAMTDGTVVFYVKTPPKQVKW